MVVVEHDDRPTSAAAAAIIIIVLLFVVARGRSGGGETIINSLSAAAHGGGFFRRPQKKTICGRAPASRGWRASWQQRYRGAIPSELGIVSRHALIEAIVGPAGGCRAAPFLVTPGAAVV